MTTIPGAVVGVFFLPEAEMNEVEERVRSRMEEHGFPRNLLPDGIVGDQFDAGSGRFSVTLRRKVDLSVGGIPVHFAVSVTGVIRQGAISGLRGVKAKQGFWIPISGIAVQGSDLMFKVGPVSKAVPRSAFDV